MTAANRAVKIPTVMIKDSVSENKEKKGNKRATKYTPATTMVALWMIDETGVGPSIALGSQICIGNMALLPQPPIKIKIEETNKACALEILIIPRLISSKKSARDKVFNAKKSKEPIM